MIGIGERRIDFYRRRQGGMELAVYFAYWPLQLEFFQRGNGLES